MNTNDQESKKILEESINQFDVILKDVSEGNTEKGLAVMTHEETKASLILIIEKWNSSYKGAYTSIINSGDKTAL